MEAIEFTSEVKNGMREIDFSVLPNEAKQELFEFYTFLLKKYKVSKLSNSDKERRIFLGSILPKQVKKFMPLKREEIYAE